MQDVKLFNNRLLFKDELVTETDMPTVFGGKRLVMFGLPGAFTPTCSSKQLPAYEDMYEQFIDTGKVDDVYCISVNDHFVMNAWGKENNVGDKIIMIGDPFLNFIKAIGAEVDKNTGATNLELENDQTVDASSVLRFRM